MTTQIQLDGDSHEDANLVQFHGENTSGSSTALTKASSTALALSANLVSEPKSSVFDGTTVTIPVSGRYVVQYQLTVAHDNNAIRTIRLQLYKNTGGGYNTIISTSQFATSLEEGMTTLTVNGQFMGALNEGDKLQLYYVISVQDNNGNITIPGQIGEAYISGFILS